MSNNIVSSVLPNTGAAWEKFKTVAPAAFGIGAGVAGIQHLALQVARFRQEREKREEAQGGSNDILTVTIPNKVAQIVPNVNPPGAPIPAEAPGTSSALELLRKVFDNGPATTTKEIPRDTLWDSGLWLGSAMAGGATGYGLINGLSKRHQKSEEQTKLDAAKKQYSDMLGKSLSGPKVAFVLDHPSLEGFITGVAEQLSDSKTASIEMISAPSALAVLSAVVAHRYVFDRETNADKALRPKRISPPKAIRLVSAPATPPAPMPGDIAQATQDETDKIAAHINLEAIGELMKEAGIVDMAADGMVAGAVAGNVANKGNQPGEVQDPNDPNIAARVENIDPNTIVVHTAAGPITVSASDQKTRALLNEQKGNIAGQLAASTAIPLE